MGCLALTLMGVFLFVIIWGFSVSPVLGIIFLIVIFGGGFYLFKQGDKQEAIILNNKLDKLSEQQKQLKEFTISQKYLSSDIHSTILLDEERKKVCFIFTNKNTPEIYNYKDILVSEILEDGKTITSTSRTSQIGGAIIGGVIAGGIGAIVGGLGGKQTSELEVNKIDLKIVVNNNISPNKFINFLTPELDVYGKLSAVKKDNPRYISAIKSANHWHSLLSFSLKQDEPAFVEMKKEVENEHNTNMSVADEIKKLSDLVNQGLLTQDEFNQQKQKILSS